MFSSNTSQTSGGYEIQRSLRFNSADSASLSRTPAGAGNRRTWTWSAWIKRGKLGDWGYLFQGSAGNPTGGLDDGTAIRFNSIGDGITFYNLINSANDVELSTTQVFRDPSAWYHFVAAVDTTQATASNRVKLYVNGSQITAFNTATYPAQNADLFVNTTNSHLIGALSRDGGGPQLYYDGYQTEINFIDGQALTPSSFGAFDAQTGVWGPTRYAGSYGTNGFYLNFSDNSNTTAATLGKDYSGNSNNWTPNNFSVSAGAGNDSLVDVPTNWGVDTGVGGSVRGNYCTMNPLDKSGNIVLADGNLQASNTVATWEMGRATFGMTSGKWYWECYPTSSSGAVNFIYGISRAGANLNSGLGFDANGWGYYIDGSKYTNNAGAVYGASWTLGDVIGVAFDADAGTLTFYKNGTSQGTAFSSLTSGPYFPTASSYGTSSAYLNFGQRPFAYTAPSGFRALNTQNLPTPTIGATTATQAGKFFNPVLYTGTGAAPRTISGVGFQPDLVWTKSRSNLSDPAFVDSVRGGTKLLLSNSTSSEFTGTWINSFNSDGYVLENTGSAFNLSGYTYVAWNWKANGAGVTNTAGSITSTVSANTTSGFSVVTFTGNSTAGATIGHGLGVAPAMVITKNRVGTDGWQVYHRSLPSAAYRIQLQSAVAADIENTVWNSTAPTATVFSVGTNVGNANQVAYCFAEVPGYSRFGSYTGNGSTDGPFVFTGFRPAYILIKRSSVGGTDWNIYDTTRIPNNVSDDMLFANLSAAELANEPSLAIDILSNGFKVRTTGSSINDNGGTMIFAAFASAPQKFALAR